MSNGATPGGRTVGRYQILEELGRGAMAVVYKGHDPVIGRTVALKTMAFRETDEDVRDLRQRLYREACAAGTLAHPNIVTIYDVIEEGGTTAVAMEFIEGKTLAAVIAERAPLPFDSALEIFEQVAAALDYANSKGIVHRDIKPANIMLTPDGRVKVADFGVARIAVSNLTMTSTVVGSPSYMSPEQVRGGALDGRSDLFAAAVVLYELLTRERPFAGDDIATTMYRIVHEMPTPPSQFNAAIGATVTAVFERALAKEPDQRFRSGAEIHAAMRQAVGTQTFAPAGSATVSITPLGKTRSRGKLIAIAALPVVLLIGLVAIGSLGNQDRQGGPPAPIASPAAAEPAPASAPESHPMPASEPGLQPVSAPPAAVSTVPPVATGPVSSVPAPPSAQPSTSRRSKSALAGGAAPRLPAAAPASHSAAAPPPIPQEAGPAREAARPAVGTASVQLGYDGPPFPLTLLADGRQIGHVSDGQTTVTVEAGRLRLRAVNEQFFLDQDFGTLTLSPGERRTLAVPGTASVFVGVKGESYSGLRIAIDGRQVPGPYPAQIPRIAAAPHKIQFRWSEGLLQGVEITDTVDLAGGRQFSIRAAPEGGQVTVQKLR